MNVVLMFAQRTLSFYSWSQERERERERSVYVANKMEMSLSADNSFTKSE